MLELLCLLLGINGLTTISTSDGSGCGVGFSVSSGFLRGQTTSGTVNMSVASIGT